MQAQLAATGSDLKARDILFVCHFMRVEGLMRLLMAHPAGRERARLLIECRLAAAGMMEA
jgi:hypothetical protein